MPEDVVWGVKDVNNYVCVDEGVEAGDVAQASSEGDPARQRRDDQKAEG